MKTSTSLPRRSRLALSISMAVSAAVSLSGMGNDALAQDEEGLEEIVVTGSRIRRQDFDANSPVVTVGQETFEDTSTVGLDTILNQLPQFVPGMTGATSGNPNASPNAA